MHIWRTYWGTGPTGSNFADLKAGQYQGNPLYTKTHPLDSPGAMPTSLSGVNVGQRAKLELVLLVSHRFGRQALQCGGIQNYHTTRHQGEHPSPP